MLSYDTVLENHSLVFRNIRRCVHHWLSVSPYLKINILILSHIICFSQWFQFFVWGWFPHPLHSDVSRNFQARGPVRGHLIFRGATWFSGGVSIRVDIWRKINAYNFISLERYWNRDATWHKPKILKMANRNWGQPMGGLGALPQKISKI